MGNAVSNKVLSGMFAGFTLAEMRTEYARYKAALTTSGSRVLGASVNSQSFQFGPRSDMSLPQWGRAVQSALAQVDPDWIAPSSTFAVRFGCG